MKQRVFNPSAAWNKAVKGNKISREQLFPAYCAILFIHGVLNPVWFIALAFLVGLHRIVHPSPLVIGTLLGMVAGNFILRVTPLTDGYSWFIVIASIYAINFMWMLTNPREYMICSADKENIKKSMKLHRWDNGSKHNKT